MNQLNQAFKNVDQQINDLKDVVVKKISFVSNTQTRAEVVRRMANNGTYVYVKSLDDKLINYKLNCWPEGGSKDFPALNSAEKATCQPFVTSMLTLLKNTFAWFTVKTKKGKVSTKKVRIQSIPFPDAYRRQTVGKTFPDCIFYEGKKTGETAVTLLGQVKGRHGEGDFPDEDVGQLTDGMQRLMGLQPFRHFMIGFLTDGYRFLFVKCERMGEDNFQFQRSSIFNEEEGWEVCICIGSMSYR